MADSRIRTVLIGRNKPRSIRYLVVAVGLFVVAQGWLVFKHALVRRGGVIPIGTYQLMFYAVLVMIGIPAVQAYRNDGLLVSWVLGTAIPLGLYLKLLPHHLGGGLEAPQGGVRAALTYGLPAGTIGFVLGAGTRRVWRWIRSRLRNSL